jgi:hypothetical protein
MSDSQVGRLLVVANRTESTPQLLAAIEEQARAGYDFTLMVPPERHPDAPDWSDEEAQRLVGRAAHGRQVELVDPGDDAAATIGRLVGEGGYAGILLCTPPEHHKHWHRHSLPQRIQELGIPVTAIAPDRSGWSYSHGFPDDWVRLEAGGLT